MENTIDKANKFGSAIKTWTGILVGIAGAIVSCTYAYYMIIGNQNKIDDLEKTIDLLKEDIKHEHKIRDDRSDKRYKRAMEEAVEIKSTVLKGFQYHETRVLDLEKGDAYMRGKLNIK